MNEEEDDDQSTAFSEVDPKKLEKIEKEKKELLAALAGGDFSTQRNKVASVLNMFPGSRNSDITLALKYWETFQPEIYDPAGIKPQDLFKLERLHYIVRARAKIQNEYGLFQADDKIRYHRKQQEEVMHDAVLQDVQPKRVVNVFADETGKTGKFVIVAAVWVLNGRSVFTVTEAIRKWKENSAWKTREVHFSRMGKSDFETLKQYLGVILNNREFLSFKVIAIERARTTRKIEEIVSKLHEHMLIRGAEHEIIQGRIDLPRHLSVTLDEEQSLDAFSLAEMKRSIASEYAKEYEENLVIENLSTVSSKTSSLIQLADLVAGAVNRRLNSQGENNYKDEMADWVIQMLDLNLNQEKLPGLDAFALFNV